MIGAAQAQFPGHSFALSAGPDAHNDVARFSWTLNGADGPVAALREYEQQRWKRAAQQVLFARFPGTLGTLSGGIVSIVEKKPSSHGPASS